MSYVSIRNLGSTKNRNGLVQSRFVRRKTRVNPMMIQTPPGGSPPPRDPFVPALVLTAIIGYALILAYDYAHSWGYI